MLTGGRTGLVRGRRLGPRPLGGLWEARGLHRSVGGGLSEMVVDQRQCHPGVGGVRAVDQLEKAARAFSGLAFYLPTRRSQAGMTVQLALELNWCRRADFYLHLQLCNLNKNHVYFSNLQSISLEPCFYHDPSEKPAKARLTKFLCQKSLNYH